MLQLQFKPPRALCGRGVDPLMVADLEVRLLCHLRVSGFAQRLELATMDGHVICARKGELDVSRRILLLIQTFIKSEN